MGHKIGDVAILFIYTLMLFLMVRPRSQGPKLVENTTNGLVNLAKAATGGGTW